MEVEVPRKLVEDLLTSFLIGALGLKLHEPIDQLEKLPARHREAFAALEETPIWISWVSSLGVLSATGRYDPEQSRRTCSHVVLIEYWIPPNTHHASWWRANRSRPTEWTAGRG